jgi:hypothetical protein
MKKEIKVFDPKKCPYEQIIEHKGDMIVFVEDIDDHRDGRVRFYDSQKKILKYSFICTFLDNSQDIGEFETSCFANKHQDNKFREKTLINEIARMESYDKQSGPKIIHIEFL